MKRVRLYENQTSGIEIVEKLLIVVYRIEKDELLFFLNPSVEDYSATKASQSMELKAIDDTYLIRMRRAGSPRQVEVLGTRYEISVDSIGTESSVGRKRRYCDFVIKTCSE